MERKVGLEVIMASFTDHVAVRLRFTIQQPLMRQKYGYWRLNSNFDTDNEREKKIHTLWEQLRRKKRTYDDVMMWWIRLRKKKIRQFYLREKAARRRKQRQMENHLYDCIYIS
jgi:hypothetical protein